MKSSWKLGQPFGIGVFLHWTFFLVPAWVLLGSLAGGLELAAALNSVLFVFAIFGCVVLHELGHALMARRFGVGTNDITLYPIGGVARLERMPERPSQELAIALAGPAVNVAIAAALFAVLGSAVAAGPVLVDLAGGSLLNNLMWVNVSLVVFNMLPAFPMDGGRVVRSLLAMRMPYVRATEIAAGIGQTMAIVFGVIGFFTNWMLMFVAAFVFLAARGEAAMARMRSPLETPRDRRPWRSADPYRGPLYRSPYDGSYGDPAAADVVEGVVVDSPQSFRPARPAHSSGRSPAGMRVHRRPDGVLVIQFDAFGDA